MWYLISVIRGSTFILLLLVPVERGRPERARSSVWGEGVVLNVFEIEGRMALGKGEVVEERVRERKVERRGDIMCLIEACVDAIVVVGCEVSSRWRC